MNLICMEVPGGCRTEALLVMKMHSALPDVTFLGQKLQIGDLSDITYKPRGSVTLKGTAWLPALTPGVK